MTGSPTAGDPRTGAVRGAAFRLRRTVRAALSSFGGVTLNYGLLALLLGAFAILTARALGPSDRGIVVLFMTLASMLMVGGSFGTNTYARVALVRGKDPLDLRDYMGLGHVLAAMQIVLAALIGGTVLYFAHGLRGPLTIVLLAIYATLNLLSYLWRDGLFGYGHNVQASRADPVAAGMQLLLFLVLWVSGRVTLWNVLLAITVGQVAEIVYLATCYWRHHLALGGRYRWRSLREQIIGGLPALISNFGQTMLFRFDRILLGIFSTTAVVGIYGVAATSAEALLLIPTAVSQVVFHRVATGRKTLRELTVLRIANVVLAVILAVVAVLICPFVIDLVFGSAYDAAVTPLRILTVAAVGMGAYLVDMACLNGAGRLRTASMVTLFGALLVVVLDLALIPGYAAIGAAIASAVAYVLAAGFAANRLRDVARRSVVSNPSGPLAAGPTASRSGRVPHGG